MITTNEKSPLADNLSVARKRKGLLQRQIAIQLMIKEKRYAAYEEGRSTPSPEILVKMAEILEVQDLVAFITIRGYVSKMLTAASY